MWPWRKREVEAAPVRRVIDDRVFLLGLDELYRRAIKRHEADELRLCAKRVVDALGERPDDNAPIEGYYGETAALTEYLRLVRALQGVNVARRGEVAGLPEFQRLSAVVSSPHLACGFVHRGLLPVARDALAIALHATPDSQWDVPVLLEAAARAASSADDISLVGIAAMSRDAVALAATRESMVLYAEVAFAGGPPPPQEFVWQVGEVLQARATRFVECVNALLHEQLPLPTSTAAETYWFAYKKNDVGGRCVRIGVDPRRDKPHYHWAIRLRDGELAAEDFWDGHVWTTSEYRKAHPASRGGT